jgi:hypothetical protein
MGVVNAVETAGIVQVLDGYVELGFAGEQALVHHVLPVNEHTVVIDLCGKPRDLDVDAFGRGGLGSDRNADTTGRDLDEV